MNISIHRRWRIAGAKQPYRVVARVIVHSEDGDDYVVTDQKTDYFVKNGETVEFSLPYNTISFYIKKGPSCSLDVNIPPNAFLVACEVDTKGGILVQSHPVAKLI